jgi:hypothetical protein
MSALRLTWNAACTNLNTNYRWLHQRVWNQAVDLLREVSRATHRHWALRSAAFRAGSIAELQRKRISAKAV